MKNKRLEKRLDPIGWTERNRKIIALMKSGKTLKETGAELGITQQAVQRRLVKMGMKTPSKIIAAQRRRRLTASQLAKVKKDYEQGVPVSRIAMLLSLDQHFLHHLIGEKRFVRKLHCEICGKVFGENQKRAFSKYCPECRIGRRLLRDLRYHNELYSSDAKFRKRRLTYEHARRHGKAADE